MDAKQPSRGLVFAIGLAVAAGWHGVLGVAAVIVWFGLSNEPPGEGCEGFGCTWSPRDVAVLVLIFVALPMLAASVLVATAVVGALAAAGLRSGVLAGTVGAFVGWLAAVAVLLMKFLAAVNP